MKLVKIKSILKSSLIYFLFFPSYVFSQNISDKHTIVSGKTIDVIKQAEKVFDIYYTFSDSILYDKYLNIKDDIKKLDDFHKLLAIQNNLNVVYVSKKLYSIVDGLSEIKNYTLNEVILNGYLINTLTKDTKKSTLKSFNTQVLPGLTDFDVLRAFQQLPGIKSPNQTANGLYIKGSSPDQNTIAWNNIRIYHPGHLFGMISPINPEIVDKATFYTTTIPTNKGGSIASFIDLSSNDIINNHNQMKIGVNMLYTDLTHKFNLYRDKISVKYGFRKSNSSLFYSPIYKSYSEKVFQNTGFQLNRGGNEFDFWDVALSINTKINEKNSIIISGILIENELNYSNLVDNSKLQKQLLNSVNSGFNFQYNFRISDNYSFETNAFYSEYKLNYDRSKMVLESDDSFNKNNHLRNSSVHLLLNYNYSPNLGFKLGYEIMNYNVNHEILSNNNDFGFNISQRKGNLTSQNINFNGQFNKKNYEFNFGSRLTTTKYNTLLFEPRINYITKLNTNLHFILSFEKRSQFIQQINENAAGDISLENYVWALTDNSSIPFLESNQFDLGIIYKKNKFFIDINAFIKRVDGITSFSEGIVFSDLNNPNSIATISNGNSLSNGIDISFQKEIYNWKFWTSYSFLNSKNKIEGINNDNYFESNGNINHSVYLSTSYNSPKYYITLGWHWNSGRPFSELDTNNRIVALNTKTLPSFHSLDLSLLYNIKLNSKIKLKTGISFNNLYNYKIIINKEVSRLYENFNDLSDPRYALNNFYSLSFTTNIFIKLSL